MSFLHQRWLERAARAPERPAVVAGEATLTYGELRQRALALAAALPEPAGPHPLVAVLGRKGLHTAPAVLGALCGGYGYVGLDTGQPAARLEAMLRLTRPAAVVTTGIPLSLAAELKRIGWSPPWVMDVAGDLGSDIFADARRTTPADDAPPPRPVTPENTAYVLFTSGSTGKPKGVCMSHGAAAAAVERLVALAPFAADDRVANQAPLSFDLSMFDLFATLGSGATLYPIPATASALPNRLLQLLEDTAVTSLLTVPSVFRHLLDGGSWTGRRLALRRLAFSGEPLPPELLRRIFATLGNDLEVWNFYGGTEMPWVFARRVEPQALDRANRFPTDGDIPYRLLPADDEAPPAGFRRCGELEVHGPCLLKGYLDPLGGSYRPRPTGAGHRTGDLAAEAADGAVVLLGRVDRQTKIRGHRVDLDGVEHHLECHPRVAAAAVLPDPEGRRLVAFIAPLPSGEAPGKALGDDVPEGGRELLPRELERYCRTALAPAMCPAEFRLLSALPSTASGKKDRRRLAAELEQPSEEKLPGEPTLEPSLEPQGRAEPAPTGRLEVRNA
jgi:amino acid adenylation domain-containing protein